MTDEIRCPECGGSGETSIGTLRLVCRFCHGAGVVGGEYEPAEGGHRRADGFKIPEEGEEYDPDVHGPMPAVWKHPAAAELPGCMRCMGSGTVISLGDILRGQMTGKLIEVPCPNCSASGR